MKEKGLHHQYVIVGSSNISNTAFNENYELDIIHTFNAKLNNSFANCFFQLRNKSKEIIGLEVDKFMEIIGIVNKMLLCI